MQFTVWLIRIIFAIWIFGITAILIIKISQQSTGIKKMDWGIFFLFPILLLTETGRKKLKESIKK